MRIVVLGVDPGCITAGFGIVIYDTETRRTSLLEHGVCAMAASLPLFRRIGIFYRFFDEKIRTHNVKCISLETSFLGKNAQNFLKLGYMRGLLYLLCDTYQLELCEFSPSEVKRAITGSGHAQKEQVACCLMRLFSALREQKKLDVTDAIAVGLCAIWRRASCIQRVT